MQSKTAKLINEERVITILECYGADADNWPEEERAAAIALINSSTTLQQRQHESQQLDELMGVRQARESLNRRADATTVANIINALPEHTANNTTDNTVSISDHVAASRLKRAAKRANLWWTYGSVAAAAVVLLAVSVIIQQPSQPLPSSTPLRTAALSEDVSQSEMDQWMWQEATGLNEGLSAEPTEEEADLPVTFMAMVELDLLPNDD